MSKEEEFLLYAVDVMRKTLEFKYSAEQIEECSRVAKILRNKVIREHSRVLFEISQEEVGSFVDNDDINELNMNDYQFKYSSTITEKAEREHNINLEDKYRRKWFEKLTEMKVVENVILPTLYKYGLREKTTLLPQYLKLLAAMLLPAPIHSHNEVKERDLLTNMKVRCGVDEFFLLLISIIAPILSNHNEKMYERDDRVLLEVCLIVTSRLLTETRKQASCIIDALCRTRFIKLLFLLLQRNYAMLCELHEIEHTKAESNTLPLRECSSLRKEVYTNEVLQEDKAVIVNESSRCQKKESSVPEEKSKFKEELSNKLQSNSTPLTIDNDNNLCSQLVAEVEELNKLKSVQSTTWIEHEILISNWTTYVYTIIANIFAFTNTEDLVNLYFSKILEIDVFIVGNNEQYQKIKSEECSSEKSNEEQGHGEVKRNKEEYRENERSESSKLAVPLKSLPRLSTKNLTNNLLKQYAKEKENWRFIARSKHGALASNGLLIKQIARQNNLTNIASTNSSIIAPELKGANNFSNKNSNTVVQTISSVYGTKRKDPFDALIESDRHKRSRYSRSYLLANKEPCLLMYATRLEVTQQIYNFILYGLEPLTLICWENIQQNVKAAEESVIEYREVKVANEKSLETTEIKSPLSNKMVENLKSATSYFALCSHVFHFTREFTNNYSKLKSQDKEKCKENWIMLYRCALNCVTLQHVDNGFSILRIYLYCKHLDRFINIDEIITFLAELLMFLLTISRCCDEILQNITIAANTLINNILQREDYLKIVFDLLNSFTGSTVSNDRACNCILLLAAIFESMTRFTLNGTIYMSHQYRANKSNIKSEESHRVIGYTKSFTSEEETDHELTHKYNTQSDEEKPHTYLHEDQRETENDAKEYCVGNEREVKINNENLNLEKEEHANTTKDEIAVNTIHNKLVQSKLYEDKLDEPNSFLCNTTSNVNENDNIITNSSENQIKLAAFDLNNTFSHIINFDGDRRSEYENASQLNFVNENFDEKSEEEWQNDKDNHSIESDSVSVVSGRAVNVNVYIRRLASSRYFRIMHSVLSTWRSNSEQINKSLVFVMSMFIKAQCQTVFYTIPYLLLFREILHYSQDCYKPLYEICDQITYDYFNPELAKWRDCRMQEELDEQDKSSLAKSQGFFGLEVSLRCMRALFMFGSSDYSIL